MQIRTARRKAFAAASLLGLVLMPLPGAAYDASIGWQPLAEASGYTLFVRYAGSADAQPIDVGSPAADPDGLLRVMVSALPLTPGVYFSVSGYDAVGVAGAVSREIPISYEQAAAVTDSDGDGLTDAREDSNFDGAVGAAESDPHDADSDDDGFTDGSEVLVYGTNPLDVTSVPPCINGDCSTTCEAGCDDGNPCTLDECELGACVHLPATARCDDGIGCTSLDACHEGACAGVNNCLNGGDCELTLNECQPGKIWVATAADPTGVRFGTMTSDATYARGADDDPAADSLAAEQIFALSTTNSLSGGSGDEIHYKISLPSSGQWYLWGRFYWPGAPGSSDANAFLARVDSGTRYKFGNNRDYYRRWHWGGDGAFETGTPTPLALGQLSAGVHTLRIEKREVVPIPPRLDAIVVTSDPAWRPSDDAALAALGALLAGPTTTTTLPPPPPPTTTTTTLEPVPTTTSTTTTTTTLPPPPPPPTTTLPPECWTAADCSDLDPCTTDSCVAGNCTHAAASSGACDDGDPCTVGDACSSGMCVGWVLDCSHLNGPCSYGVCDPQLSECATVNVSSGTSCNDGSACTTGDVCGAGVCRGIESCAAGSYCDAATKTCKVRTEIWLSAARDDSAVFTGAMTSSTRYADGDDVDLAADSIETLLVYANSTRGDTRGTSGDRVSYAIDLPASGAWYLWGRFYYPGRPGSNDANSFTVRVDAGSALSFGNSKGYFRRWHFGGDGRKETGTPAALPLGQLAAGPHTLTIIKREVSPIPPRLDILVLTQNATWVPTDVDIAVP